MGKIGLQVKANLENVTELRPNGEDFRWYLRLQCLNCGEETDKWQYLTICDKYPMRGSRGEANLVSKCKLCGRDNSVDILKDSISSYTADESNQLKTMIIFDCRGLEPIDFSPRSGFSVKGLESNTMFDDVNLEEKEWVEYDEKASQSVAIYDFSHKFVKL